MLRAQVTGGNYAPRDGRGRGRGGTYAPPGAGGGCKGGRLWRGAMPPGIAGDPKMGLRSSSITQKLSKIINTYINIIQ
jgi:hypothetical protein